MKPAFATYQIKKFKFSDKSAKVSNVSFFSEFGNETCCTGTNVKKGKFRVGKDKIIANPYYRISSKSFELIRSGCCYQSWYQYQPF